MMVQYTVAIRIGNNGSTNPKVFLESPLEAWVGVVKGNKALVNELAKNYVGLVQIKMWGKFSQLMREIRLMVYYRPLNLLHPAFWFFALGTMLVPSAILRNLVQRYRRIPK